MKRQYGTYFQYLGFSKTLRRLAYWAPACLLFAFCIAPQNSWANDSADIKERLNKIFYWQIADELKLSQKAEKEMVVIVEDIQGRRNGALLERQAAMDELKKIEKKITSQTADPILKKYQLSLSKLAKLDSEEHERLKSVLGTESLAKFYLVRESVALKIREALKNAESSAGPPASKK